LTKFYLLIVLTFIVSSCDFFKDDKHIVCNSNCYEVSIKGKITDRVHNIGVDGIPVTFRWVKSNCWFCPENKIDKESTNNLGAFSFNNSIDTSFFSQGYSLFFSISDYPDYIISPYDRQFSVYDLKDNILSNLNFDFYPKAMLQIEIERVENDNFQYFSVEHSFRDNISSTDYIISYADKKESKVISVETASDIKTYIKWSKTINSVHINYIDSINCQKNKINYYKIKY
jgi:hypothetical protein